LIVSILPKTSNTQETPVYDINYFSIAIDPMATSRGSDSSIE